MREERERESELCVVVCVCPCVRAEQERGGGRVVFWACIGSGLNGDGKYVSFCEENRKRKTRTRK